MFVAVEPCNRISEIEKGVNVPAAEAALTQSTEPPLRAPRLHHIAIQTRNLENCRVWYQDFFGCHVSWSLSAFNELTLSRLPGITQLIEVVVGDLRFHLFERDRNCVHDSTMGAAQFQHVCISVDSHFELDNWRHRWLDLFASGRYEFALPDPPTDVVVDASGVESFYAFDVNGLEFEFTYVPRGAL